MYVCLCNGITDKDISQVLKSGVTRKRDIFDALGARMACAKCAGQVGDMIDRHIDEGRSCSMAAAE
ncbi:MAG: (2Fe-2S)-binding protein [Magnetovibrionaceae bacterium]